MLSTILGYCALGYLAWRVLAILDAVAHEDELI